MQTRQRWTWERRRGEFRKWWCLKWSKARQNVRNNRPDCRLCADGSLWRTWAKCSFWGLSWVVGRGLRFPSKPRNLSFLRTKSFQFCVKISTILFPPRIIMEPWNDLWSICGVPGMEGTWYMPELEISAMDRALLTVVAPVKSKSILKFAPEKDWAASQSAFSIFLPYHVTCHVTPNGRNWLWSS